ncbi:MAG TPA: glycosyltransferase family 39 protein [Phycisphaerae bacterium]|nr:glycosyltransferase family 39 protein [Phycisphaerae bacterium]
MFLALLHVVLNRLVWREIPLQTDTGMWAYIGRRILDGALPYRDLWESKPPGIYYLIAGIERLFGDLAVSALCWLDGLVSILVFGLTFWIARLLTSGRAAAVVTLPLSLVFCHRVLADWGCNLEKFVAIFEMAACGLVLIATAREKRALFFWAAAGLFCGIASLFKQTGIAFLVATSLYAIWRSWTGIDPFTAARRAIAMLWIGFIVVWLPVVGGMAWAGNLTSFVDQVVFYDLGRAAGGDGEADRLLTFEHWRSIGESLRLGTLLFGPALVAIVLLLWRYAQRRAAGKSQPEQPRPLSYSTPNSQGEVLVAIYALLALLPIVVAPFGYGHYLLQAAPPCAVLMACWLERVRMRRLPRGATLAGGLFAAIGVHALGDQLRFTLSGDTENAAYAAQRERVDSKVSIIQRQTRPADSVMLWPPDYAASYYARRRTPLECSNSDVIFKGKIYRLDPPMSELLARLRAAPPQVIIDFTRLRVDGAGKGETGSAAQSVLAEPGVSLLEEPDENHRMPVGRMLAPLKQWVRANYGGQRRVGHCTIYRPGESWRPWTEYLFELGEK